MLWTRPEVMRFGATLNLYGPEELAAFRKGRPGANLKRTVMRLDIVSFGQECASITLEFEGATVYGRQSQVCVRLPEGWRIVQAHIAILPPA